MLGRAIKKIASTKGLEVIVQGPGDLSASLEHIIKMKHTEVVEAVNQIVKVVYSHPGMILGYQIMNPADLDRYREKVAQLIIPSQDTRFICQA